ncbi:hypothetical protein C3L33_13352, partial [Rhododendron williamsianum]
MGPIDVTQVATGLSVLAGAVFLKSVMDQNPTMGPTQFRRCPSCNGSGRVACLCSRWSDGDVGCRTCAGSGRMACSSCGGKGTGRPLPAQNSSTEVDGKELDDGAQTLCSLCPFKSEKWVIHSGIVELVRARVWLEANGVMMVREVIGWGCGGSEIGEGGQRREERMLRKQEIEEVCA